MECVFLAAVRPALGREFCTHYQPRGGYGSRPLECPWAHLQFPSSTVTFVDSPRLTRRLPIFRPASVTARCVRYWLTVRPPGPYSAQLIGRVLTP